MANVPCHDLSTASIALSTRPHLHDYELAVYASGMDLTIRPAALSDDAALASLVAGLDILPWTRELSPDQVAARVREHLALAIGDASHTVLVADCDSALVGYVAVHWLPYLILHAPEGYVSELFVRDGARGAGVGSALLDAAAREARVRGCSRLSLLNRKSRESYLRGFYRKRGWQERPEIANFIAPL